MKLTGRDGELRIIESSDVVTKGSTSNLDVEIFDDSEDTFTDKSTEAFSANSALTGSFFVDTDDALFVGSNAQFARIKLVKGASGQYAVGAGALIAQYYNGSSWELLTVLDGTLSGVNTFAADGIISFQIPKDWAKGGHASLDEDFYYIKLLPTSLPSTPPSLDLIAPVDGMYYYVPFSNMDFSGPIGRMLREELLVLNRGKVDAYSHYIEGGDAPIMDGIEVSHSCIIDDIYNRSSLLEALYCGNPASTNWASTGVSTKGDTKNDGTNFNPVFADTDKKTVNVQILWNGIGFGYYEVYHRPGEQSITESDEGLVLSVKSVVFGVVERIYGFGNRY